MKPFIDALAKLSLAAGFVAVLGFATRTMAAGPDSGEPTRIENKYEEVLPKASDGTDQVTGVFYYKVRRHLKYKVTVSSTVDRMEYEPGYQYDATTGENVRVEYPLQKTKIPQTKEYEEQKDAVELRYVTVALPKAQVEKDSVQYDGLLFTPGRMPSLPGMSERASSTRPDASAAQTPAAISASARDSSRSVEPSRQERRYDEVLSQAYEGTNQVTGVFYYKVRRHVKYKVTVQSTADRMEFEPGYQYDAATGENVRVEYPVRKIKVPQTKEYEEERDVVELRYVTVALPKALVEKDSVQYGVSTSAPEPQPASPAPSDGASPSKAEAPASGAPAMTPVPAPERSNSRSALPPAGRPAGEALVKVTPANFIPSSDPSDDGWRSAR